ncbi:MAG: DUF3604 domain-containing protein [Chloroflexota bacterium]
MTLSAYQGLRALYGDLHGHCEVGYGSGTAEEAYRNAQVQLDFACVVAHAHWPDLPADDPRLPSVVEYHQTGFARAAKLWPHLQDVAESVNQDAHFASFLGYEWHSMAYGDYNVYHKQPGERILQESDLPRLRAALRRLRQQGTQSLLIPHHIGYQCGYRGINWQAFNEEFSPVAEVFSMHGLAESEDGPYPYLHGMGPRSTQSTFQYGLAQGKVVGAIGSTDHHAAYPGSYGHGRLAVWATELTRAGIWDAITARRTYALTGDRINLAFAVNDRPMGSVLPPSPERHIAIAVDGGDAIDCVEVLHNNRIIHRYAPLPSAAAGPVEVVKVLLEFGWGIVGAPATWDVEFQVLGGELLAVEPRFRGPDVLAPEQIDGGKNATSAWRRLGSSGVSLTTHTWGNPTAATAATQGMCLEIRGSEHTYLEGRINGRPLKVGLAELLAGSVTGYLGGFLAPAYRIHRARRKADYTHEVSLVHRANGNGRDWYYVRVRQRNDQWAWSSPIWIEAPTQGSE